jgi:hypothetical protein
MNPPGASPGLKTVTPPGRHHFWSALSEESVAILAARAESADGIGG